MKNSKSKIIISMAVGSLLLVSVLKVNAQEAEDNKSDKKRSMEFGLRFMPTFTKFDVKNSSGSTVKGQVTLGYGVGAMLGVSFTKHVGMQVEAIYSSISQKYTADNVNRKINLRYFNIPLLVSFNTNKLKPVNLNLVAGPQLGISVGSSVSTTGTDTTAHASGVLSVKKSDVGFAYGAGVDFGLNHDQTIRLGLGFRGVYGLFDVSDNSKTAGTDSYYVLDRTHINTNSIYMGLSILF